MEKVLAYLNNYFYVDGERGTFIIKDSKIELKGKAIQGQYIKLEGSILNDGIYKIEKLDGNFITLMGVIDEVFEGIIYKLAIPKDIIKTCEDISTFNIKNKPSAYISESNEGYSYSKGTNASGNASTWKDVFKEELSQFKQIYDGKRRVKIIDYR